MGKKRYNQIQISPSFILICLFAFLSCKNHDFHEEIRKVDQLIDIVLEAENTQVIDQERLRNRMDSMLTRINKLNELDTTRMSTEFRMDILRYKSIFQHYGQFLEDYNVLEYKNDAYRLQLKDFKEKTINRQFSREEFQNIFKQEKINVDTHLSETKRLIRSINEVETVYRRINHKLIVFFEKKEKPADNF